MQPATGDAEEIAKATEANAQGPQLHTGKICAASYPGRNGDRLCGVWGAYCSWGPGDGKGAGEGEGEGVWENGRDVIRMEDRGGQDVGTTVSCVCRAFHPDLAYAAPDSGRQEWVEGR